jgi:hypothetical protein
MKQFTITLLAGLGLLAAGCQKDNITPPTSQLTGRVIYQNEPVGVRGQGNTDLRNQGLAPLELWQRGEKFRNKIELYINQDGTYSATLFDGDYKLTRRSNGGPWQNSTDSIDVKVRGNTVVDVPVQPYYVVRQTTIAKSGSNVTASGLVSQVSTGRNVEGVTLFLNTTQFVDTNNSLLGQTTLSGSALSNLSQPLNLSVAIPATAKGAVYARIGVRTQGVGELYYSPVQKITL